MPGSAPRLSLSLALLLATGAAAAAPPSRLAAAIDARSSVQLRGSVRAQLGAARDTGRLDGATVLHGVSLDLGLSPAQEAERDALLARLQDPRSPDYHAWLTPQQYAARFGLSEADQARVLAWLRGQGLEVEGVDSGGSHIRFGGSVTRLEAAFQTELHRYQAGGRSHFANSTELAVPAALSGMVLGLRGLDDFHPRPHIRPAPAFTSSQTGNHFLSPGDIATIYNINPLYAGHTGSGRTIAVVGQTAINVSDVAAFRSAAGLPAKAPTTTLVPNTGAGTPQNGSEDMVESDLDVQWAGAVARDADVVFVYTGGSSNSNVFDALHYAIVNNVAPVISVSYGNCEANNGGTITTTENWFKQANAQGQTIVASSGDSGAADCDTAGSKTAVGGLAVDYPAASPEVTGVGGTEFSEGGSTAYWAPQNTKQDIIASALSYIPEVVWNDTATAGGLSATGGGKSTQFAKPAWQTGAGVPADNARDVPDVALAASPSHDGFLFCTTSSGNAPTCVNGFRNNDAQGTLTVAGGTSFSAPVFASVLTLVADRAGVARLGNANPMLYQLAASNGSAFHDIVSGNNNVPTLAGGSIGYSAGPGYDLVTGLGTVDVTVLADAWSGAGGSSSGGSSSGGSSSSGGGSSSSSSSSSSSGGSSSSGSGSGGGGGGGGAWAPLPLLGLAALGLLRRRRR